MNDFAATDINQRLAAWSETFAKTLGDAVQSIVLFGGLAKGEFLPGQSDVNVLLVFRTLTVPVLDLAAPLIRQGGLEFRLAAMLVTEAELRDSADVFPIKFQDMRRHHRVILGESPFPNVVIAREHVRLRCEQELRNLSLRLRQSYVHRADRPELLQAALNRGVSSLLLNLGVLVELKTGKVVESKRDALANAAQLGLPPEPLQQAWAVKCGGLKPDSDGLRTLFAAFMDAVQQGANLADKLK
jgi:predicted nucleotidyltransferase